jgi:hypothetical protein
MFLFCVLEHKLKMDNILPQKTPKTPKWITLDNKKTPKII